MSDKVSKRFAVGVVVGLGFSMSVILATLGIMDGFENSLKIGLKKSSGDLTIHSRDGFFKPKDNFAHIFDTLNVDIYTSYVKSEGFLIYNERSKGVQVTGIDKKTFQGVTGLNLKFDRDEIAIGKNLAEEFEISLNDSVVLAFPNGNKEFSSLPLLRRFKVGNIITHGIYEKDLRIIYVNKEILQAAMNLGPKVNALALNIPDDFAQKYKGKNKTYTDAITDFKIILESEVSLHYFIKPFWREYSGLIEAVKAEKAMISIILQIIVVISIFNVVAFIIFINEQRAREIFLFKAVGMSQRKITRTWSLLSLSLWGLSCLFSELLVRIMRYLLNSLDIFKLPGEIYVLGQLDIKLDIYDYSIVFLGSFVWLFVISTIVFLRMRKSPILKGLRQEFA
jgi:ABC-type lipoprotein release transport system permease subunit